jgi:hypothetical protein
MLCMLVMHLGDGKAQGSVLRISDLTSLVSSAAQQEAAAEARQPPGQSTALQHAHRRVAVRHCMSHVPL